MKINWFPGHMTKALRMMQEEIKKCDAVIYVLDSRAPCSSLNPSFLKIIGEKPVLYVLNKCDLVDEYQIKLGRYMATKILLVVFRSSDRFQLDLII